MERKISRELSSPARGGGDRTEGKETVEEPLDFNISGGREKRSENGGGGGWTPNSEIRETTFAETYYGAKTHRVFGGFR